MAIKFESKTIGEKETGIIFIDNGDLVALTEVMNQYGFINHEALLRYAMVALLNSSDNKLYIKDGSNIAAMCIAESLIKKHPPLPE